MRVVAQRVTQAHVEVEGKIISQIEHGLMLLVAFTKEDTKTSIEWMADKIVRLRIFDDDQGVMNRSVSDTQGQLLVVSQFTLYGEVVKGSRPSYIRSAPRDIAIPLYQAFIEQLDARLPGRVRSGQFGADMQVMLINDGPVTLLLEK